jgi:hypothetical protein
MFDTPFDGCHDITKKGENIMNVTQAAAALLATVSTALALSSSAAYATSDPSLPVIV